MGFWEAKTRGLCIQGKHELYSENLFQNKKEWRGCEVVQRTEAFVTQACGSEFGPEPTLKVERKNQLHEVIL